MRNFSAIRRVLVITLLLNLVATAAKLIVGYLTGSISLVADGLDSVFDSASNIIGLVGIYIASRPADEEHPYGHRKFETMAAISISILLFLTCMQLVQSAWVRLKASEIIAPVVNVWSFAALLLSIAVHITVVSYEYRKGRELKSDILVADALHTRADIYISVSVIAGLIAVKLGQPVVDPILALIIAALIFKIGLDIIRSRSRVLLDGVAVDTSDVERIARAVQGVTAVHRVRSRGHEDDIYIDLHVKVNPSMATEQAHSIAHEVERRLLAEVPGAQDVIVHIEPERAQGIGEGEAIDHNNNSSA